MKNSKIFFIATVIGIIITIVLIAISIYYGGRAYDIAGYTNGKSEYHNRKIDMFSEKEDFYKNCAFVVSGISTVLLITGIVVKIKEKGGIEIVD